MERFFSSHVLTLMSKMALLKENTDTSWTLPDPCSFRILFLVVFWAEAIVIVVHVINVTPSSSLSGDTPHSRVYTHTPRYDFLRVFGCKCFVFLPPHERDKLSSRAVPCIYLGISSEHRGYC